MNSKQDSWESLMTTNAHPLVPSTVTNFYQRAHVQVMLLLTEEAMV